MLLIRNKGLVKTRHFKDFKYVGDVLNAIKIFNEKQVDELALLDIDAAVKGVGPDIPFLAELAKEALMPLCYGGGVSSADEAARIISVGFEKVSVSSAALDNPMLISEMASAIGSQSVVVALDVRFNKISRRYSIYTHNGSKKRPESLSEFCSLASSLGAGELLVNSIDRDGEMNGYDLRLARLVRSATETPITVLGGAGHVDHMKSLIREVGVVGAAAGSLFVFKGVYRAVLINYSRPFELSAGES